MSTVVSLWRIRQKLVFGPSQNVSQNDYLRHASRHTDYPPARFRQVGRKRPCFQEEDSDQIGEMNHQHRWQFLKYIRRGEAVLSLNSPGTKERPDEDGTRVTNERCALHAVRPIAESDKHKSRTVCQ